MFQTLETRRLLSNSVTVSRYGDELTVKGGDNGSVIRVIETNRNVTVESSGTQIFSGSSIKKIKILGKGGPDQIFYQGNSVGACIDGDGGRDEITVADTGSAGSVVTGGEGADDLIVLDANCTWIFGEGGADNLYVSDSVSIHKNIFLFGMSGADFFNVAGGTNFIVGGTGMDTVVTNGTAGVDFRVFMCSVDSIVNIPSI